MSSSDFRHAFPDAGVHYTAPSATRAVSAQVEHREGMSALGWCCMDHLSIPDHTGLCVRHLLGPEH